MAFLARNFTDATRVERGKRAYHAGASAEEQVAARYVAEGCTLLAQRWRAGPGELDLVLQDKDGTVIFVEVKKSSTFEKALTHLNARQMQRIFSTAELFLATLPKGIFTPSRVDVGLVDGAGQIAIHENFFAGGF